MYRQTMSARLLSKSHGEMRTMSLSRIHILPLHLSADPAEPRHPVDALDYDLVASRDLQYPAEELSLLGEDEFLQVGFV